MGSRPQPRLDRRPPRQRGYPTAFDSERGRSAGELRGPQQTSMLSQPTDEGRSEDVARTRLIDSGGGEGEDPLPPPLRPQQRAPPAAVPPGPRDPLETPHPGFQVLTQVFL